jgi:predicted nucleic acid-binding protein
MKKVLVDTDVLIDFLRGNPKAKEYLSALIGDSDIFCSAITVAEICSGIKAGEEERTRELVNNLEVLDVTRPVAEKAGYYKRTIRSHALELDDCLIAATASVAGATLVTGNAKHYPMRDIEVRPFLRR